MLKVTGLAAFDSNYLWLIHNQHDAWVVDPGDAPVVLQGLTTRGLKLAGILVTHHHSDHVGGIAELLNAFPGIPLLGPGNEGIAGISQVAQGGQDYTLAALGLRLHCMAVPGHTLGHLAYYAAPDPANGHTPWLFVGDTLFAAGCGRIFEGTPEQMFASLQKLAGLPEETQVFCAHEYTVANLMFAKAVEPSNPQIAARLLQAQALRDAGLATVPFRLGDEQASNPYFRCHLPAVQAAAHARTLELITQPEQAFAAIRAWKNVF